MSFVKGAIGLVCGIVVMVFGALMTSVAGYGIMAPVYEGVFWLGLAVFLGSPAIYWGGAVARAVRENT